MYVVAKQRRSLSLHYLLQKFIRQLRWLLTERLYEVQHEIY